MKGFNLSYIYFGELSYIQQQFSVVTDTAFLAILLQIVWSTAFY